jgi:hypothetical protein
MCNEITSHFFGESHQALDANQISMVKSRDEILISWFFQWTSTPALRCLALKGTPFSVFSPNFIIVNLFSRKKRGKIKGEQNKHKKKKQSGWAWSGGVGGSTSVSCPFYIMQHKNPEKKTHARERREQEQEEQPES